MNIITETVIFCINCMVVSIGLGYIIRMIV